MLASALYPPRLVMLINVVNRNRLRVLDSRSFLSLMVDVHHIETESTNPKSSFRAAQHFNCSFGIPSGGGSSFRLVYRYETNSIRFAAERAFGKRDLLAGNSIALSSQKRLTMSAAS